MPKKLLFVCIGNSCRSQMAEGFARALGKDDVEAWSAGSKPTGRVNPNAIAVMKEKGIDISRHESKKISDLPLHEWDVIITMGCGDACPYVPGKQRLDWPLPDPVNKPIEEFRKVRDDIESRVKSLLKA